MITDYSVVMPQGSVLQTGLTLTAIQPKPGVYHVEQNRQGTSSVAFLGSTLGRDWTPFSTTVGVVKVRGFINKLSFDTIMEVNVSGICIGTFNGNPQTSMAVNIDLDYAAGKVQLSERGDDIWLHVDLHLVQVGPKNQAQPVSLVESVCMESLPQEKCEPWIPMV